MTIITANLTVTDRLAKLTGEPLTREELVASVRAYARKNYERPGGWDYIIECWTDEDIDEAIGRARTATGAMRNVRAAIKPLADYRDEVIATGDW